MSLLYALEGLRNGFWDAVFSFFTLFGEETLILLFLCLLYWCGNKRLAYQVCLTYFLAGLAAQFLKILCRVPRPWVLDPSFQPVASALETATGYSFPSGHTQGAAAVWGTLGLWAWRQGGKHRQAALAAGLLLPALVGLSRMYLGVHTPWDVAAGYLLSLAAAFPVTGRFAYSPAATHPAEPPRSLDPAPSRRQAGLLFGFSLAVTLAALWLVHTGYADGEMAADGCKAGAAGMAFALGWYLESHYIRFSTQGSLPFQALKLILGAAGALLIQTGLKPVLGETIPADILRYFLLVFWVMVGFPMGIRKAAQVSRKKP